MTSSSLKNPDRYIVRKSFYLMFVASTNLTYLHNSIKRTTFLDSSLKRKSPNSNKPRIEPRCGSSVGWFRGRETTL